ncbi:enoyl-CoA hydratase-related protein [Rubrivirga sp. S365]|uniref:Enoyl-CoA hydratase-related protein n=1 Tax=Rubrivirga litoralis TaxID=3075598 RepID=A0ABU3BUE8_9BACT|nr:MULTISPECIES: enoyl-CoA hydratase-related protein [unclassified Rubrivirga]MDT0632855.1 enoyl-CoA hydratase-related protein [Rubrivirga sp. F394]MDT7855159.1 enoyl-CoA hydratase-related protein [Rubrivirga sp. S365]
MPDFQTLQTETDADGVLTITLDRPDALNALSQQLVAELSKALRLARQDSVRGVVITGAGEKAFAAGADIGEFAGMEPLDAHRFAARGQAVFSGIESTPKPVVAAVNGFALGGGCELAMACHLRVASETAQFGQPEVQLGLIAGYGGTQRLPRLVGRGIATEMLLTGDRVSAQRAYEIGLVNRVVPAEELIPTAKQFVLTIASKAPVAVAMTLQALRAADLPLPQGLQQEAALFAQCAATEDFAEGVGAFLNRETPQFQGR